MKGALAVSAITRMIAYARGRGRIDVKKCADTVARAYEASGDAAAAAAIRQALMDTTGPSVHQLLGAASGDKLEWFEPTDLDSQLVLDGAAGAEIDRLVTELQQAHRLLAAGIDAPTRILFVGPSGTGKTLAARWLGGRLGLPVAVLRVTSVIDSHLGRTGSNIANAFECVKAAPTILFFDEIDALCSHRGGGGKYDVEEMARSTTALLQLIDMAPPEQIVLAATNFREKIDQALIRRLPTEVTFRVPSDDARAAMIRGWWGRVPYDAAAHREAVEATRGRSGAETRALAMSAARTAVLAEDDITAARVRTAAAEMWDPSKER